MSTCTVPMCVQDLGLGFSMLMFGTHEFEIRYGYRQGYIMSIWVQDEIVS